MQARYDANGRRQYQAIDRRIRSVLKRRGDECGICLGALGPIDYDATQYEPLAFEVDHVIPISRGGLKTLDNSRASHRACNRQRSNTIDADAIAAGATVLPSTLTATGCPIGPCDKCRGIHPDQAGVSFVTRRRWSA
jgi:hypothetical protein